MTIGELLDYLDGAGLVITDEDEIIVALSEISYALFDIIPERV